MLSFSNSLKGFGTAQELMVFGLMAITMIALLYFDFNLTLKIGIVVLAFTIIFLVNIASQLLKIQKK
jgi:hypothetical protein